MAYLIIGIVITVFSALFALSGCQTTSSKKPTIEELAERGRERIRGSTPTNVENLAMCYSIAPLPMAKYICPECGNTTIFADSFNSFLNQNTIQYRLSMIRLNKINQLEDIHFKLDESQFCRFCSPDITEPKLGLIVYYKGKEKSHRTWGINSEDIILISEFLIGKKIHVFNNVKIPIEECFNRLNELLDLNLVSASAKNKN